MEESIVDGANDDHLVYLAGQYKSGPYDVVLFQPQCQHLSQAVTGRVGISWENDIQVTQANSQRDTEVLPPRSKVCHCQPHISKVILICKYKNMMHYSVYYGSGD